MENISEIIDVLTEIMDEQDTPKGVRMKLQSIIQALHAKEDQSVAIHKAQDTLAELSENMNLSAHIRNQVYSVLCSLEQVEVKN